jgi:hypothetical protein
MMMVSAIAVDAEGRIEMNKYLIALILVIMSLGGWWLLHQKDADFFEAWVGSMTFFGLLFCALAILAFAPNFLPFS